MDDRAFCFCMALAILMVSNVVISPDDSQGVVLAKVMKTEKEIRSDDKKRVKTGVKTPIDRRPGWVPGGSVVFRRLLGCWRMVWPAVVDGWRLMLQAGGFWPFWEPERQGGRAAAGGWWCCRWLPGLRGDGLPGVAGAGNGPAAICGGNSAVFNQLLTTFIVVAMVWRLTVFWLCSKGYSRRALPGR